MPKDIDPARMALIRHALIEGTNSADNLEGIDEDDRIVGFGGNDTLDAGGGTTDDTLEGGEGNDLILGNAGDNFLSGDAGNDTLNGNSGVDTVAGGAGDDVISLWQTGGQYYGGAVSTSENDEIAGNDTLDASAQILGVELAFFGTDDGQITGGLGGRFYNFDAIIGSPGGDVFLGAGGDEDIAAGGGNDSLRAGGGDDNLSGGAGNDTFVAGTGNDTLAGGDGTDQLSLALIAQPYTLTLSGPGAGSLALDDGSVTSFTGIEGIAGGDGADTLMLTGDIAGALLGGAGDDTLTGGAGNDTLAGGTDDDAVEGGAGDDVLVVGTGTDALGGGSGTDTLDLGQLGQGFALAATGSGAGTVTLDDGSVTTFAGIEGLLGGDGDNTLAAGNGITRLAGGAGDDTLTGSDADDLLDGGADDDDLTGGAGDDTLVSGAGSDVAAGGDGTDTLDLSARESAASLAFTGAGDGTGSFGDDNTLGVTSIEVVLGGAGGDLITGDDSGQTFDGAGGSDTLAGGAGDDALIGGEGNDALSGDAGEDTLAGGLGDNSLAGGAGTDTATFDVSFTSIEAFTTEDGFRLVSASGEDSVTGVEIFEFTDQTLTDAELTALATPDTGAPGGGAGGDDTPLDNVNAPVGDAITSRADPAIGDALFGQEGTPLLSIDYQGSPNAIGLLPEGYVVTDGQISIDIDNGIFLSSGGGPGTTNTTGSFGVDLGEPGNDLLDQAVNLAFDSAGGTNDAAVVTFTFDSALLGGEDTFLLNVFFGSEEFPEFADSSFVDIAAVYVNGENFALFDNDPGQPLAIVGESINTPGNFFSNGQDGFNTEYDGISAQLTVLAPVQEGVNEVTIGIADTGDSIYDSGIWVGNASGTNIASTGTFISVPGTDENDVFNLNSSPQIVDRLDGKDVVRGDLEDLDNDIINVWGDNDRLIWTEVFDPDAVTINLSDNDTQAEVLVDTNGDGTAESRTLIFGRFGAADFVLTEVAGGVQLTTLGALPEPPVRITGTDGADSLRGGTGDDQLSGRDGQDTLSGGEGADTLAGGAGDDEIYGFFDRDVIGGGAGDDTIYGGDSNDVIGGGDGRDSVLGGQGNDYIAGGAGGDLLDGEAGADTVGGSFGHDAVYGGLGNDSLGGGTGQDSLFGGRGNDTLGGGQGNDYVEASTGANFLAGGGRDDTIVGGLGTDTIIGGSGNDQMTGRAGADVFVFNTLIAGEVDVITDFEVGIDTIQLRGVGLEDVALSFDVLDDLPGVLLEVEGHSVFVQDLIVSEFDTGDLVFV